MLLDHILKWVYMKYSKLGFGIVIERYGYDKRHMFVTMRCERSGKYKNLYEYWNVMRLEQGDMDVILSCDETKNVWTFSMIYGGT